MTTASTLVAAPQDFDSRRARDEKPQTATAPPPPAWGSCARWTPRGERVRSHEITRAPRARARRHLFGRRLRAVRRDAWRATGLTVRTRGVLGAARARRARSRQRRARTVRRIGGGRRTRARRPARDPTSRRRHSLRHDDRNGRRPPGGRNRPRVPPPSVDSRRRDPSRRGHRAQHAPPRGAHGRPRHRGRLEYVDKQEEAAYRVAHSAPTSNRPTDGARTPTASSNRRRSSSASAARSSPLRTSTSRRGTRTSPR